MQTLHRVRPQVRAHVPGQSDCAHSRGPHPAAAAGRGLQAGRVGRLTCQFSKASKMVQIFHEMASFCHGRFVRRKVLRMLLTYCICYQTRIIVLLFACVAVKTGLCHQYSVAVVVFRFFLPKTLCTTLYFQHCIEYSAACSA